MAYLDITHPDGSTKRIVLEKNSYVIGRDPQADIFINNSSLSRQHARIFLNKEWHMIEDLGSVNGVTLNGHPIGSQKQLPPHALIQLGDLRIRYETDQAKDEVTFALVGRKKPYAGQEFLLPKGESLVGRGAECSVVLNQTSISRKHAQLVVGKQHISIKDLKSSNGVYVNKVKITQKNLQVGDIVRLGDLEFELIIHGTSLTALKSDKAIRLGLRIGFAVIIVVTLALLFLLPQTRFFILSHLGYEKSSQETYNKQLVHYLQQAEFAQKQQLWAVAIENYQKVLTLDPLHEKAQIGILTASHQAKEQKKFLQALTFIEQKNIGKALLELQAMAKESFYASQAQALYQREFPNFIAQEKLEIAKICQAKNQAACLKRADNFLLIKPDDYLISTYKKLASVGALLDAAFFYSVGELKKAQQAATSATLRLRLQNIQTLLSDSEKVFAKNKEKALPFWQQIVRTDALILPSQSPSLIRYETLEKIATHYFWQGEDAFNRGQYLKAHTLWQQGKTYSASNEKIVQALQNLQTRAEAIVQGIGTLDRSSCKTLQEIVIISQDKVKEQALKRFEACKKVR